MNSEFDATGFRAAAVTMVCCLPEDVTTGLLRDGWSALLAKLMDRGRRAEAHLRTRGRDLPASAYPQLAAALISVRPTGVRENIGNAIPVFDRLVASDVPVELAVQSRLLKDENDTGLLIRTWRIAERIRATRPELAHPLFVTMVVAALGGRGADVAVDALVRADELAGAHRLDPATSFPVLGNVGIVGQVAAYRVAVLEQNGELDGDPAAAVAAIAARLARDLRAGLSGPTGRPFWRGGGEQDSVALFGSFAELIGGRQVRDVFRCLHRELTALTVVDQEAIPLDPELAEPSPAGLPESVDEIARHLHERLYQGISPVRRDIVDRWVRGERAPDDQYELPFLVDRLRRLTSTAVRPVVTSPLPGAAARIRDLAARIADARILGFAGTELYPVVLPPLWTRRADAVLLASGKLKLVMGRGASMSAKSALVSAIVVRGPSQWPLADARSRMTACLCGVDDLTGVSKRTAPDPAEVCPHRSWDEPGCVENYSSLMVFADYATPDAVRAQVKRYADGDGPWAHWVAEAFR